MVVNQVSVGTTPTLIAADRPGRRSITIIQEGAVLVRIGDSGVSMATGVPLPATQFASLTLEGGTDVYGIVASGAGSVSVVETF